MVLGTPRVPPSAMALTSENFSRSPRSCRLSRASETGPRPGALGLGPRLTLGGRRSPTSNPPSRSIALRLRLGGRHTPQAPETHGDAAVGVAGYAAASAADVCGVGTADGSDDGADDRGDAFFWSQGGVAGYAAAAAFRTCACGGDAGGAGKV